MQIEIYVSTNPVSFCSTVSEARRFLSRPWRLRSLASLSRCASGLQEDSMTVDTHLVIASRTAHVVIAFRNYAKIEIIA